MEQTKTEAVGNPKRKIRWLKNKLIYNKIQTHVL